MKTIVLYDAGAVCHECYPSAFRLGVGHNFCRFHWLAHRVLHREATRLELCEYEVRGHAVELVLGLVAIGFAVAGMVR